MAPRQKNVFTKPRTVLAMWTSSAAKSLPILWEAIKTHQADAEELRVERDARGRQRISVSLVDEVPPNLQLFARSRSWLGLLNNATGADRRAAVVIRGENRRACMRELFETIAIAGAEIESLELRRTFIADNLPSVVEGCGILHFGQADEIFMCALAERCATCEIGGVRVELILM